MISTNQGKKKNKIATHFAYIALRSIIHAMYTYHHPKPIVINLAGKEGFMLREKAAAYMQDNQNKTGAERGTTEQQGFGALAEMVIRSNVHMPEINPKDHPLGYDLLLPSGVKLDVKCRGGDKPFQETYDNGDGVAREAKHNFFARQLHDERLDADAYLMTHLEHPKAKGLPGTKRQKKWILYICGWVSKKRVIREGVFLPPGAVSERGREWFAYRANEIEFYNKNLNGLTTIQDLLTIEKDDVKKDSYRRGDLNLTSIDVIRMTYDLIGREVLSKTHLDFIQKELHLTKIVKPILHANQYFHLLKWLQEKGEITESEMQKARTMLQEEMYEELEKR